MAQIQWQINSGTSSRDVLETLDQVEQLMNNDKKTIRLTTVDANTGVIQDDNATVVYNKETIRYALKGISDKPKAAPLSEDEPVETIEATNEPAGQDDMGEPAGQQDEIDPVPTATKSTTK